MLFAGRNSYCSSFVAAFFLVAVLFLSSSCNSPRKVSGKYFAVRNSPVSTIEFSGRKAVLTTSGMLRIVFELDYELKEGMLYLKDPANGPIAFKVLSPSEIRCCDSSYGAKFRKKDGKQRKGNVRSLLTR